jgi:hypothetical protein
MSADVIRIINLSPRAHSVDRRLEVERQGRILISLVVSLIVASEPGDLAGISDEVHKVPSLAVTEAAVERVLSI